MALIVCVKRAENSSVILGVHFALLYSRMKLRAGDVEFSDTVVAPYEFVVLEFVSGTDKVPFQRIPRSLISF